MTDIIANDPSGTTQKESSGYQTTFTATTTGGDLLAVFRSAETHTVNYGWTIMEPDTRAVLIDRLVAWSLATDQDDSFDWAAVEAANPVAPDDFVP